MIIACVDLEKAYTYDRVYRENLWRMLVRYKVGGQLLYKNYSIIAQGESSMCTGKWKTLKMVPCISRCLARVCNVVMAV